MLRLQGTERGFALYIHCPHLAQNTHTHTHARKWDIPATLLDYQGQGRIIPVTQRRLSKRGGKHNRNSSKCRHFYSVGGSGVRQVLPSQGASLGWWPVTVAGSAVVSAGVRWDELVYRIGFRPNYKQPCWHSGRHDQQIKS